MQTVAIESSARWAPGWLTPVSALGMVWNAYGAYQYAGTFTVAGRAAMTAGMTPSQAALYLSLPSWISLVFAVGVFGGLVGSLLLALGRRSARPVLAASLTGYGLLFAGDAYHGVFAALPLQLAILATVVLIALGLLVAAQLAARRGLLKTSSL